MNGEQEKCSLNDDLGDRHRWESSIKVDLKEGMRKWTGLIWCRIGTSEYDN
jgi:hypothetical protein